MPKEKVDFAELQAYLPMGSLDDVLKYIFEFKVQLTVTRKRQSILGDYRHPYADKGHRISVNGDLNKFSFLITLLHEIAHLITFEKNGRRVQPHGQEWKTNFGLLLADFTAKNIFPQDVHKALQRSINNPSASSCGDEKLLRVLKSYDPRKEGVQLVEELAMGEKFIIKGNRIFEKGEKIRKRIKCKEIATGKLYLFSPVFEVEKVL
jgi:SprT protein